MRRAARWFRRLPWWGKLITALIGLAGAGGSGVVGVVLYSQSQTNSTGYINRWFDDPGSRADIATIRREPCPGAPFLLPSDGLIGLLWGDTALPYHIFHRHTGIDIFGDGESGEVPVYAAYDGYLTRLDGWKASVIIQHDDPLQPGRTIWTYYTHMASEDGASYIVADFPPGTARAWVPQGTLLGYQGNYSGGVLPTGVHLHFSIVTSDADGAFKNEAKLDNTLDPSPYLGMTLRSDVKPARPITCR